LAELEAVIETDPQIVVIVTALGLETEAVLRHLGDSCTEESLHGTVCHRGKFEGWDVAVVEALTPAARRRDNILWLAAAEPIGLIDRLDKWRAAQEDKPTQSEGTRRLMVSGLDTDGF
jgi:hypothetical protein